MNIGYSTVHWKNVKMPYSENSMSLTKTMAVVTTVLKNQGISFSQATVAD